MRPTRPIAYPLLLLALATGCSDGAPSPPRPPAGSPDVPAGLLSSAASRQRGHLLSGRYCAGCHGRTGAGDGPRRHSLETPPTDFTDPAWRRSASPQEVYRVIRGGVPERGMPAWRAFTEEDTWALVAWVLTRAPAQPQRETRPPPAGNR